MRYYVNLYIKKGTFYAEAVSNSNLKKIMDYTFDDNMMCYRKIGAQTSERAEQTMKFWNEKFKQEGRHISQIEYPSK